MGFEVDAYPTTPDGKVILRTKFFPIDGLDKVSFLLSGAGGINSQDGTPAVKISFRMATIIRVKNKTNLKPIVLISSYECTPNTGTTYPTNGIPIVGHFSWARKSITNSYRVCAPPGLIWNVDYTTHAIQLIDNATNTPPSLPFSDVVINDNFIATSFNLPGINFSGNFTKKVWETLNIYDYSVVTGTATIDSPITTSNGATALFQAGKEIIVNEGVILNPGVVLQIGLPVDNIPNPAPSRDFAFCTQSAYATLATSKTVAIEAPPKTEPANTPIIDKNTLTAFPNPTTGETTIRYEVAKEGSSIEVFVFNMLGERVVTLANVPTQSAGAHEVAFDASKLAEGIYIYTLIINGERISKKLVVTK